MQERKTGAAGVAMAAALGRPGLVVSLLLALLSVLPASGARAQTVPLEPLTIPCTGGNVP